MVQIIQQAPSMARAAQKLTDAANRHGGQDNISVVLLQVTEQVDVPT
jgi:serine/threonine protein phosphatase PrpC